MKYCPKHKELGTGVHLLEAKFCYQCGAVLVECPGCVNCKKEILYVDTFCPYCGTKHEEPITDIAGKTCELCEAPAVGRRQIVEGSDDTRNALVCEYHANEA